MAQRNNDPSNQSEQAILNQSFDQVRDTLEMEQLDSLVGPTAITTQNLNPNSGTSSANSTVGLSGLNGVGAVMIQITGTYTGALTPQITIDGANWIAVGPATILNQNTGAYSQTIASATQGIFEIGVSGFTGFRISANAAVTGTANVTLRAVSQPGMVALDNALPTGSNTIGSVNAVPKTATQVTGQQTSNTTAVQLTSTSHAATYGVIVKALAANTGKVYVGVSGVTTSTGFELSPGDQIATTATNANVLYVIGLNNTDKVCYLVY